MIAQKETPTTGQAAGATDHHDIIPDDGSDRKLFATMAARAALKGHTLAKCVDGYMLSRWSHSKHVADLGTVDALLQRMGA